MNGKQQKVGKSAGAFSFSKHTDRVSLSSYHKIQGRQKRSQSSENNSKSPYRNQLKSQDGAIGLSRNLEYNSTSDLNRTFAFKLR